VEVGRYPKEYMLKGSLTPIGSIIGLLAYGKYVAKRLGSPGAVTWDVDGEDVRIKDIHISMRGFRLFVKKVVSSARELLKKRSAIRSWRDNCGYNEYD
jgi:hypothetical protein